MCRRIIRHHCSKRRMYRGSEKSTSVTFKGGASINLMFGHGGGAGAMYGFRCLSGKLYICVELSSRTGDARNLICLSYLS